MQVVNGSSGLCMTCNNSPTCMYRASRGPALFCETFDYYTPPVAPASHRPDTERPSGRILEPVESEMHTLSGLCVNCQHRAACTLLRPAGGVWHCEEYA